MEAQHAWEIHQLLARYCHILDARDWNRLTEVFLRNSTLDAGPELGVHEGLDNIVAFWRRHPHPDAHHTLAVVIHEEVNGTVRVESKGLFARATGLNGGDYDDVVVRTNEGWRFLRRSYRPRWSTAVAWANEDHPAHPGQR